MVLQGCAQNGMLAPVHTHSHPRCSNGASGSDSFPSHLDVLVRVAMVQSAKDASQSSCKSIATHDDKDTQRTTSAASVRPCRVHRERVHDVKDKQTGSVFCAVGLALDRQVSQPVKCVQNDRQNMPCLQRQSDLHNIVWQCFSLSNVLHEVVDQDG